MKLSQAALFFAVSIGNVSGQKFYYDKQDEWANLATSSTNECAATPTATSGNSPIDIPGSLKTCDSSITSRITLNPGDCTLADLKFTQNDHGVKADYVGDCTKPSMVIPEKSSDVFTAAQFHIHTGCEHKIAGEGCDAELHIVHLNAAGTDAAVLGFMIDNDADKPDPMFDGLIGCWGKTMNDFIKDCQNDLCTTSRNRKLFVSDAGCGTSSYTAYDMVPSGAGYYQYRGGLTTPPCSQIVWWNLVDTKVSISLKQWANIAWMITEYKGYKDDSGSCVVEDTVASQSGSTSRKTQPIGEDRPVVHKCGVSS